MVGKKSLGFCIVLLLFISLFTTLFGYSTTAEESGNSISRKTQEIYNTHHFTDWYYKPSGYSELITWYQTLETQYPDYIEVFKANELYGTGNITGGYDAYYVRITNETLGFHKPEVLFCGSPHGNEVVGTIGMYWFADWLMRYAFHPDYGNPDREWLQWLLDNREIYFEVSHNPYGFDWVQRYDANGWDLNREADHDGPGSPTGGIWASVNGQTLRRFVDNHTIRVGCDFHGGTRALLYSFAEQHSGIAGTSPIDGITYGHAPPDFYFYDVAGKRAGLYMGDLGGDGLLDGSLVTTIWEFIWYPVYGGIAPWAYAADVVRNPLEDPYVEDETFGNYPGAGILWYSPEMSYTKNPSESTFGNDTVPGWGMEIRRYILQQTDIALPYVRLLPGSTSPDANLTAGNNVTLKWEVNGCLVVDHTNAQWGTDPDPITTYLNSTPDYDQYAGAYMGGTGWDNASDGNRNGVIYTENITLTEPGEYYFVVKAQVDQIYNETLAPSEYGVNHSYLRLVKERVNGSYYEALNGTDGLEILEGQLWWYSDILHVSVDPGILTHEFSLHKGWNLITLPIDTQWTAEDLGNNITDCTLVIRFDATTQDFETHIVGVPWDDFPIEKGMGYFVYVTDNNTLSTTGWPFTTFFVPLHQGWNLIGWPHEYNTTAESLGTALTNCTLVIAFNETTKEFITHVVGIPHDDFPISRGTGLFIYTTENSIWSGTG